MYLVEVESGVLWRQHADHIKDLQELELFGEERAIEDQQIIVDATERQMVIIAWSMPVTWELQAQLV